LQDLLIETSIRFAFFALPMTIALFAASRALRSESGNVVIYIGFAGYAAVSAATVVPWALYIAPPTLASFLLSLSTPVLWIALNGLLRRPLAGYAPEKSRWRLTSRS